ncbi:MAG: hypothetical protein ACO3JG_09905, partial [Luteolibacter sp.]
MTTRTHDRPSAGKPESSGFALVVTLSLMILLTVVAVGLLGLSALSLRSSSQGIAQAEARANARLALMLAIGELQKQAGPDTRVTAPADLVDRDSPPLTGVWRSWEGTNHQTLGNFAGRPITPDYAAKKKAEAAGGRFLTWLVSGAKAGVPPDNPLALVRKTPGADSVPLLSAGSLAQGDTRQIHAVPQPLTNGSFAWWVSGENQKARLPQPYGPKEDSAAGWSAIARSHAVADPAPFGLDALLDDPKPAEKAVTFNTVELLAAQAATPNPREFFHDLSAGSVGLLTNTATGGWRKDFSLLSENRNRQPKNGLPLFQLTPTTTTRAAIPTRRTIEGSYPPGGMLYPWSAYRPPPAEPVWTGPIYRQGAISSWENLFDYATYYQRILVSADGRASVPLQFNSIGLQGPDTPDKHFDYIHRVRILPVVARIQWVFSHSAERLPKGRPGDPERYQPRLLITPAITFWNPYNVEITAPPGIVINLVKAMPAALRYTIGGQQNPDYNGVAGDYELSNLPALSSSNLRYQIPGAFTLMPGETRLFSPVSTIPVPSGELVDIAPGFRSGGGNYCAIRGPNGEQPLALPGSTTLKADAKFDTICNYFRGAVGVTMYLDIFISNRWALVYRMIYSPEMAAAVYPPITGMASATLSQCAASPQPFLSTIFGVRAASNTALAAKGFARCSPFVNHTSMGVQDIVDPTIAYDYPGTTHPVNSSFDYSFVAHAAGGDSFLPNASGSTGRGYIVSGFNKADGLSRCVLAELPLRPLASLAELTHWDVRFENSLPPYAFNIIANSDANPLLPPDKVVNARDAKLTVNFQHDDSYCTNHLLFDDWFFSSIAPEPSNFGSPGRSMEEVYTAFLSGDASLTNHAYRPIMEDAAASDKIALLDSHIRPADSWRKIASRLEVDGMFNVNSTSVTAWRALLGHARDQRVPIIRESGTSWNAGLSGETDHVWNRFSIAGDTEAGKAGSSGAFPEATEFAGYRSVNDDVLDQLADNLVAQIRARGPFLSLAEFVNRQLSSGDLALAGALQAALDQLGESASTDPLNTLKSLSKVVDANPPNPPGVQNGEEYQFREAAAGHSAYGVPGWTRQADILRPLAPILSARDDTFTIRCYGDARDSNGKVLARAWCEASVRRTRGFVDP